MKDIILALDFDGTLYRLEEHDSEEMLMAEAAKSPEEISLMDLTIARLRRGMDPHIFEETLRDLLIGKPLSVIQSAVDRICPLTTEKEMDAVRRMAERPNVHLHIVSCGTDLLIEDFLRRTDLLDVTEGIHAKLLLKDDETFINFVWTIRGPEDKAGTIDELRRKYGEPYVIAVGDGLTDGPMLERADSGFIIEWPGGKHTPLPFPHIGSFSELEAMVEGLSV